MKSIPNCKSILLLYAILLIPVILTSCEKNRNDETAEPPKPGVRVFSVQMEEFSTNIESFGSIVYTKKNDITSAVEGTVARINLKEGDPVTKGEIVTFLHNMQLTIRREQALAALRSAEANLELAIAQYNDYRRQIESRFIGLEKSQIEIHKKELLLDTAESDLADKMKLLEVGGVTEESIRAAEVSLVVDRADYEMLLKDFEVSRIGLRDSDLINSGYSIPASPEIRQQLLIDLNSQTRKAEVDVARAQRDSAQTELASIDALIDELTLESPITGVIGAIYKEDGERVESGDKVFTVFESVDAWAVFPVNEDNMKYLHKEMKTEIIIDALQQEPLHGTIDIISPTVDPQSGNITVKALIKNLGVRGKPGMFARITIFTGSPEKKIFIPSSSLVQKNGSNGSVLTIRNNRVFRRKVTLGMEYKDTIEINGGLSEGELIVLEPTPVLRDGDEVTIYD
jgi:RND family efflux transporter MFP subunit